jgi:ubiquitin C-terminal hydrolase
VGYLQATVSELQFCRRVLDTFQDESRSHELLDWVATLGSSMVPLPSVPETVTAYLETIQSASSSAIDSASPQALSERFDLTDARLYEVKRRFHSMVQSSLSAPLLQGDPMAAASEDESQSNTVATPKQAISTNSFVAAVTTANEEMGHGGYLPTSLAKLVFEAGCARPCSASRSTDGAYATVTSTGEPETQLYWTLANVLQFGGTAVRVGADDVDTPLLRWLFAMFQSSNDNENETNSNHKLILNRQQVARMLTSLLEHADFRLDAASPPQDDDDSAEEDDDDDPINAAKLKTMDEAALVELDTAVFLGIVPPRIGRTAKDGQKIELKTLVDYALKHTKVQNVMDFDDFCAWNQSAEAGPTSRLGALMMDLRLIAAVLFGIPPLLASMEISLITEIERRHKARYPQSSVSRRGPRGTIWYIIDASWLNFWATHVKKVSGTPEDGADSDSSRKGVRGIPRINNASLLAENGSLALLGNIRWKHEYEILPPLGWNALQAWYDGGPPIHRSVVRYIATSGPTSPHSSKPRIPTENEIELYPFFVTVYLCDAASRGEARPFQQNFQLSRVTPVGVTLVQLCKELDVDPDLARLWVVSNDKPTSVTADGRHENCDDWIVDTRSNIVEQRKRRSQSGGAITLLLEIKDMETGLWPRGVDGKEWSFRGKSSQEKIDSDLGDGVVGLYNMGNTCYLNSSIQCLSHTPIFREYFTSKAYLNDINTTNPLGHQGHLAQVSAVLINSLWKQFNQTPQVPLRRVRAPGSYAMVNAPSLTPKTFKDSLGKFNDHFAGNEQHDAQELLAFLLGGLSEDLNRIMDKPYIEAPDSDGRPDHELADIWWTNHLKREMSIIVALFTGQYKSLLTCRSCKYESARFEPFSFLQLPLPEDDQLTVSLVVYPLKDGTDTLKYCVRVNSDGKLRDVLLALAKLLYVEQNGKAVSPNSAADEESEKERSEREALYQKMAQNFSVVDMRDGYISKIAPNTWSLQDLQNKETGDLPLLHVYELESPIEDSPLQGNAMTESDGVSTDESSDGEVLFVKPRASFLAIAQRRSELVSQNSLHPLAHRVFGTPILMRVNDLQTCTGRDLYDLIAARVRNVVPKQAIRFLSEISSSKKTVNLKEQSVELTKTGKRQSVGRTTTDMEEVSAGPVPRYGFRLRITSRDGRRCLICRWFDCCVGCLIPDDDEFTTVLDGDSIVVDWHFAVDLATGGFGQRLTQPESSASNTQQTLARTRHSTVFVKNHSSCGGVKGNHAGSITLEQCLDAFAEEEKIPEAYCSRCKDFRVQTKRMSLWRLPPVVIIQLKRFQFTQHMRRKLRDLVVFPIEGLDLSRIMAPDSVAPKTVLKMENDAESNGEESNGDTHIVGQDRQTKDDGRSEMLYDLYGVVHHQGALSGGHYVASLKSEFDGQWRLFNDAQIYEIHDRDVVDASAYILFYIRRDVSKAHLSNFWETSKEGTLSEEDMDTLLKGRSDRCVIS